MGNRDLTFGRKGNFRQPFFGRLSLTLVLLRRLRAVFGALYFRQPT